MRQLAIILVFLCISPFLGYPQKYTIELGNNTIEEVLLSLEQQYSRKIFYANEWFEGYETSGQLSGESLDQILPALLEPMGLSYISTGNHIIIMQAVDVPLSLSPRSKPNNSQTLFTIEKAIDPNFAEIESSAEIIIGDNTNSDLNSSSTVAGYVRELSTGESIIGALVFIEEPFIGATTDSRGFFSLSLPNGQYDLHVQFIGLEEIIQPVVVRSDGEINFEMAEEVVALKEITIESERDANISQAQLGLNSIDVKSIKNVPLVLGEPDILKVATTLPGVQTVGEAATGYNVRGGAADQNLILVDGITIYNPSHFFGFFSVLNSKVIKKLDLYKSSLPVQYGGRLSSVFDMTMIDGNKKEFSGEGNVSIATAGLTLQGPLVKDKTSFVLGARTTYSDWVLNLVPNSSSLRNSEASFYDLVGKVSHQINDNNEITVSGYYSKDRFRLSSDSLFSYHNASAAISWRRNFNNRLIGEFRGAFNEYDYDIEFDDLPIEGFNSGYKVRDQNLNLDFGYFLNERHRIDFGFQVKRYEISPGFIEPSSEQSIVEAERLENEEALESSVYISDSYDISSKLSVYAGIRYSIFNALGPGQIYLYSNESSRSVNSRIDSIQVGNNQVIETYHGPEIRVSARYYLGRDASLKLSYNRTRQFIHQLSNTIAVAPTDIWKLSDTYVRPQIGDQYTIGYFRNLNNSSVEASIEGYYKDLTNVLDFKDGTDLTLNQDIEADVIQGNGKAYGLEFFIKKKKGKLNGWFSYTYSRTFTRFNGQFPEERINSGEWFPANYDKPHSFTAITNYRLTRRYSLSTNITFSTGRPITFPIAKFNFAGGEKIHFSERNEFRIPNYFRIDIGFNVEGNHRIKKLSDSFWNFSIYNLLGRRNPYSVFFQTNDGQIEAKKLSIFGAPIPTITYHFKF